MDIYAYLDTLTNQIYMTREVCTYVGGFNRRGGDEEDYIPVIDNIPEEEVIDFTNNSYWQPICETFIY